MNKKSIPEYRAWKAMKARCYAPCLSESSYQKAGITVCDEWVNDFARFFADVGEKPSPRHSLDRIDNSKGYSKENCRWTTQDVQSGNRGDFNKVFEHGGKAMILKDWARETGIKYTTLYQRIYRHGLSFDRAISDDPFDRLIEINGEKRTVTQWCRVLSRKPATVINRIHDGWDRKRAVLTPTINQSFATP